MTAPGSPSGTSPLRIAGLALLGLGAVAGLIGIATVATSGSTQQGAAPPTSVTSEPTAGAEPPVGPTPTSAGSVPVPEFTPTPTNAIAAPQPTPPPAVPPGEPPAAGQPTPAPNAAPPPTQPPAAPPAVAAAPDGKGTARAPVRVYNNSTIHGLAARAADDFRNAGWQVDEVSNWPSGIIPTSTVYYRPGTDEQAAATTLANQFGMRVEPRFAGLNNATAGLIVIVTNDYQRR